MKHVLLEKFKQKFNHFPEVYSTAPGRINIIGEHTDYNKGYVLPAAIHLKNNCLLSRRDDGQVLLWAENFQEKGSFMTQDISPPKKRSWVDYIKGIYWCLEQEGMHVPGLNCLIYGNIPIESGLSSSAALEASVLNGMNTLFDLGFSKVQMAKLAQRAESNFVGVQCGLMDQFVSFCARNNSALFLDCETLQFHHVPLRLSKKGLSILVYETGVRRELAFSEYNKRRQESEIALRYLQKFLIKSYKEATPEILKVHRKDMEESLYKRARHVITENERVLKAFQALKIDDFDTLGDLLFQSHRSLRDDYAVSCPELDLLYEFGMNFPGCLGARLTGAGFGGSGIAIIRKEVMKRFSEEIIQETKNKKLPIPKVYQVRAGEGARSLKLKGKIENLS